METTMLEPVGNLHACFVEAPILPLSREVPALGMGVRVQKMKAF